jgi:hypothetical protein
MTTPKQPDFAQQLNEYRDFISQMGVGDICILSANMKRFGSLSGPRPDVEVNYKDKAQYANQGSGFMAFHRYDVTVKDDKGKKRLALVSVTFAVYYVSKIPMTDQIFEKFCQLNLPLNTWPYFREFTHNSLARMNLPEVIAPAFVLPGMPKAKKKR